MSPNDENPCAEDEQDEKLSRMNEFRRMIEEYAHDLREIIQKLRKRLH